MYQNSISLFDIETPLKQFPIFLIKLVIVACWDFSSCEIHKSDVHTLLGRFSFSKDHVNLLCIIFPIINTVGNKRIVHRHIYRILHNFGAQIIELVYICLIFILIFYDIFNMFIYISFYSVFLFLLISAFQSFDYHHAGAPPSVEKNRDHDLIFVNPVLFILLYFAEL